MNYCYRIHASFLDNVGCACRNTASSYLTTNQTVVSLCNNERLAPFADSTPVLVICTSNQCVAAGSAIVFHAATHVSHVMSFQGFM